MNTFIAVLLVVGIVIVLSMLVRLFVRSKKAAQANQKHAYSLELNTSSAYSKRGPVRTDSSLPRRDHAPSAVSSSNTNDPYDLLRMQYLMGVQHDESVRTDTEQDSCDVPSTEPAHGHESSCDPSPSYDSGSSSSYDGGSSSYSSDYGSSSGGFDSGGGGGGFD